MVESPLLPDEALSILVCGENKQHSLVIDLDTNKALFKGRNYYLMQTEYKKSSLLTMNPT